MEFVNDLGLVAFVRPDDEPILSDVIRGAVQQLRDLLADQIHPGHLVDPDHAVLQNDAVDDVEVLDEAQRRDLTEQETGLLVEYDDRGLLRDAIAEQLDSHAVRGQLDPPKRQRTRRPRG